MEKQLRGRSASGGWQWERTAHTQRALLDAAREVFTSRRFSDASIADRVQPAGARACLQGVWQRRRLALLFLSRDGPPGFEVMMRRRGHEWVGQNDVLLN